MKDKKLSKSKAFPKNIKVTIRVERSGGTYTIYQNNLEWARFRSEIKINKEAFPIFQNLNNSSQNSANFKQFIPPEFGVTTLGNSHGFDMTGSTSGFIVWLGGKGIMVDPPPFSSNSLKMEGIHPSLIEKIILSHCHADHDSGAFHKILEAQPIELLSTETILRSFVRKYSAITGVPISDVNKLVRFRPVKIGHLIKIHGGKFRFFYAFHSIPTIGFEVERNGKSFYFSGDTFYDPESLTKLYLEKKLFNHSRYKQLSNVDFSKHDLIFHEAGIPPIHTPQDALYKGHKQCNGGLFLYHCTESSLKYPELKIVPLGIRKTIVLSKSSIRPSPDPFRSNMELLASVELVSWLPINRMLELLDVISTVKYPQFKLILKVGTTGSKFYIIKKGAVRIFTNGKKTFEKILGPCDFFGESSIFGNGSRLANVEAIADTELIEINKFDFFWVFGDPTLPDAGGVDALAGPIRKIKNLSRMRREKTAEFINENSFIRGLSEGQKNYFNMLVTNMDTKPDQILWKKGAKCSMCFFVKEGKFQMIAPQKSVPKIFVLCKGSLVGDFPSLLFEVPSRSALKCITKGSILVLSAEKLRNMAESFPSIFVYLKDKFLIY